MGETVKLNWTMRTVQRQGRFVCAHPFTKSILLLRGFDGALTLSKNQRFYGEKFKLGSGSGLTVATGGRGPRRVNLPRAAWRYVGSVSTILEAEELDRAGRFRFERLQRHFVVSRFLRHVLGQYSK